MKIYFCRKNKSRVDAKAHNRDAITRFATKLMAYAFVGISELIEAPGLEFLWRSVSVGIGEPYFVKEHLRRWPIDAR